jgi:hypothetical protein
MCKDLLLMRPLLVSILIKLKNATLFSVQFYNNKFNKCLSIGLGVCSQRTDGQRVEGFLKAEYLHFFPQISEIYSEWMSEATQQSKTPNRI